MVTLHLPQWKWKFFKVLDYKSGDPYTWWGQNKKRFPTYMYANGVSTALLCIFSNISSLFSATGNLHDDKRNRILPTLTEDLYCLFRIIFA